MTDRELLEKAAKAAGIDAAWHAEVLADEAASGEGMWLKGDRSPDNSKYWNPLTSDADALRLAVKLGISIAQWPGNVSSLLPRANREFNEEHGTDPYAATRRAIVMAAAAMAPD